MEEYIYQIHKYLPANIEDEQTKEFVDYLTEAYLLNVENEKYQFAFTAFHMLYMTCMYRTKWFLKEQGNEKLINAVNNLVNKNSNYTYNNIEELNSFFDFSQLPEQTAIDKLLSSLPFHSNDIRLAKNHVNVRNDCSHASGKIHYGKRQIDNYINEEIETLNRLQEKITPDIEKAFEEFISINWQENMPKTIISNWITSKFISIQDLLSFENIDFTIKRKLSNNRENLLKKILFLTTLSEIDNNYLETTYFLDNLPILMNGIVDEIEYQENPQDAAKIINTQEIIEERILPLIANFSKTDIEKAQNILKINLNGQ